MLTLYHVCLYHVPLDENVIPDAIGVVTPSIQLSHRRPGGKGENIDMNETIQEQITTFGKNVIQIFYPCTKCV